MTTPTTDPRHTSRAATGRLACQDPAGPDFTTPDLCEQAEAAAICATCPVADICRATARQYDQAYQTGTDPYGAYGCWGGWWFDPGKTPRRILPTGHDADTEAAAAPSRPDTPHPLARAS